MLLETGRTATKRSANLHDAPVLEAGELGTALAGEVAALVRTRNAKIGEAACCSNLHQVGFYFPRQARVVGAHACNDDGVHKHWEHTDVALVEDVHLHPFVRLIPGLVVAVEPVYCRL